MARISHPYQSNIRRHAVYAVAFTLILPALVAALAGCGPSTEDRIREVGRLSAQARQLFSDHDYDQARAITDKVLSLCREGNLDSAQLENQILVARIQRKLGQYDSALVLFRQTVELSRLAGNQRLEVTARIALADFLGEVGEEPDAYALAEESVTSAKFLEDWEGVRTALFIAQKACHSLGRWSDEWKTLAELARIDSECFNADQAYTIIECRLLLAAAMNDTEGLRDAFADWKTRATSAGDSVALAAAFVRWGAIKESLAEPDSAFRAYSHALELLSTRHDPDLERRILFGLANTLFARKNFDSAKRYYTDLLDLYRRTGDLTREIIVSLQLSACEWNTRGNDTLVVNQLVRRCEALRDTCRRTGFRPGEAYASFLAGRFLERRDQFPAALKHYQNALKIYEESLTIITPTDLLTPIVLFMSQEQTDWYNAPLEIYCAAERTEDIVHMVERRILNRTSRFFSCTRFVTGNPERDRAIRDLQWRRSCLRLTEEDILDELSTHTGSSQNRLRILQEEYQLRRADVLRDRQETAGGPADVRRLINPLPPTLKEIQDTLGIGDAVIQYVPRENTLYIAVVTPETAVVRKAPIKRSQLFSFIGEYTRLIGDPRSNGGAGTIPVGQVNRRLGEISSILHSFLLEPIEPTLRQISRLYAILPEEFGWLPLHTLRGGGGPGRGFLIEKVDVRYLPAAHVLFFRPVHQTTVERVVGLGYAGNTEWDVEYELKDVRAFYRQAKMLFGKNAAAQSLRQIPYDLLHICAEFSLDTAAPNRSQSIMSDGTTPFGMTGVTLGEWCGFPPAKALVFSNIAPLPGALFRYMPYAMLASGHGVVIATMWQGERKAKKYFGEVFYTSLLGGISPADSYQQAMVALTKEGEFSPVHRWGLYYCFGR